MNATVDFDAMQLSPECDFEPQRTVHNSRIPSNMNSSEIIVRSAEASDIPAIAAINVVSWQKAYRHLMSADFLVSLSEVEMAAKWRQRFTRADSYVLLAEQEGKTIGYVECGREAEGDELMAFYVHPDWWSRGVGRALWQATRSACLTREIDELFLWVLAGNARALRFYADAGFTRDAGAMRMISRGGMELSQWRMWQRLTRP